jgi:hypothetical protein
MRTNVNIIIAGLLLLTGAAPMVDWFIFCSKPEFNNLKWEDFKAVYVAHFPESIRPLFASGASTWICILLLTGAGLLYLKTPYKILKVPAIICFVLAFWNLFSLM